MSLEFYVCFQVHVASQTVFSNFPDKLDNNLKVPTILDFSLNSGYFTVGTHKGKALLYRYLKHYAFIPVKCYFVNYVFVFFMEVKILPLLAFCMLNILSK